MDIDFYGDPFLDQIGNAMIERNDGPIKFPENPKNYPDNMRYRKN